MADEKKPVDGTEEQADEAKSPETELTPETTSDAVVTEEDDAAIVSDAEDRETPATPDATRSDEDTLDAADDHTPGDATVSDDAELTETVFADGEDSVADTGHDTVSDSDVSDSAGLSAEGRDTISDDAQIHSAGEAEMLAADAHSSESEARSSDPASVHERLASSRAASAASATTGATAAERTSHETVVERKGGFVPMLLGGVIAAALGFGASSYQSGTWPFETASEPDSFREDTTAALDEQGARLDALAADVQSATDTANGIDLSQLESAIEGLRADLDAASGSYDELAGRIDAIERRPIEESVSPEAMAAYENELNLLRDAIAQQRQEVEEMTQQALDAESNAEQQAALSKARAALSEVYAALSAGAPYAEEVNTIEANGVSVPAELSGPAGDGVPTLSALTEDYPPAAREALSQARRLENDEASGTRRFATFLADQVGARSVTPRAGDAPDAILSRAEAALRDGDLQQALTELEALPDEAKAPLSDWMDRAQTRVAAVSAADGLAQELNKE